MTDWLWKLAVYLWRWLTVNGRNPSSMARSSSSSMRFQVSTPSHSFSTLSRLRTSAMSSAICFAIPSPSPPSPREKPACCISNVSSRSPVNHVQPCQQSCEWLGLQQTLEAHRLGASSKPTKQGIMGSAACSFVFDWSELLEACPYARHRL